MEMVRLESLWLSKLSAGHWNENCFKLYHHILTKYKEFCVDSFGEFPSQVDTREASAAQYLFNIHQSSKRPMSLIKMAWAAITPLMTH